MTTVDVDPTRTPVGALLRRWRERRHLSQLQLSFDAEVSTRHLSFLETGRSRPTREMLERLADHLDIPIRERNELMLAGGFAPRYPHRGLDAPELRAVSTAFRTILDAHLPHPALVLDRWWDVVDSNAATDLLLAGCAAHLLEPPVNAVRVTLHPDGLAPRIRNLGQWRTHLLGQVRGRAERTGDQRLSELLAEASGYPGADAGQPVRTDVVIPLHLDVGGEDLRFFGISAAVESALDVTIDELRLEAFYPADAETAAALDRAGASR